MAHILRLSCCNQDHAENGGRLHVLFIHTGTDKEHYCTVANRVCQMNSEILILVQAVKTLQKSGMKYVSVFHYIPFVEYNPSLTDGQESSEGGGKERRNSGKKESNGSKKSPEKGSPREMSLQTEIIPSNAASSENSPRNPGSSSTPTDTPSTTEACSTTEPNAPTSPALTHSPMDSPKMANSLNASPSTVVTPSAPDESSKSGSIHSPSKTLSSRSKNRTLSPKSNKGETITSVLVMAPEHHTTIMDLTLTKKYKLLDLENQKILTTIMHYFINTCVLWVTPSADR